MASDEQFTAFYRTERDPVRRALALTLRDADLAGEAVDEAMARAYQRWSRVSQLRDPAGWVYRVGLNWATSWLRKRRLRPHLPHGQAERLSQSQGHRDVDTYDAVASLPLSQRSVIVLRFYLDWPIERIAAALELPEGTVKSRIHRATARLGDRQEVTR